MSVGEYRHALSEGFGLRVGLGSATATNTDANTVTLNAYTVAGGM
jgi:hypothetical protein